MNQKSSLRKVPQFASRVLTGNNVDGSHLNNLAYPAPPQDLVSPMSNLGPFVENIMNQSFTSVRVGRYTLPNRLVMAPMTRSRAKSDGTPGDLALSIMRNVPASA